MGYGLVGTGAARQIQAAVDSFAALPALKKFAAVGLAAFGAWYPLGGFVLWGGFRLADRMQRLRAFLLMGACVSLGSYVLGFWLAAAMP